MTVSDGTASTPQTFTVTVTAVNDTPTIAPIAPVTTTEDTASAPVTFTIGDVETPATALTVTATSSNVALVPDANLVLSGTGADRTLVITPAADQAGTATITVTVSDGTASTPQTFTVTVTAVNDAPTLGADCQRDDDRKTRRRRRSA